MWSLPVTAMALNLVGFIGLLRNVSIGSMVRALALFAISCVLMLVFSAVTLHSGGWAIYFGVCGVFAVVGLWLLRQRMKRRPISKLIGEKAKAIRAALVRTQRETERKLRAAVPRIAPDPA